MEDLIAIDLATLKHAQLRTLCVQSRNAGHLAPHVKCNVNTSTLIARLKVVQVNLRQTMEPLEHTTSPLDHSNQDMSTSSSNASILSSLPHDVVIIIASHMISHSSVLALVAANPGNIDLVRALYNPRSSFWTNRLGNLTGKGPLTGPDGVTVAADAPWTPRDQHNALLPRGGFFISSLRRYEKYPDLVPTPTNIRVRQAFDMSPIKPGNTGPMMHLSILTLGEDGVLRYPNTQEDNMLPMEIEGRMFYMQETLENAKGWVTPLFIADDGSLSGGELDVAPTITLLAHVGYSVAALDTDGRVWIWYRKPYQKSEKIPAFSELVFPRTIPSDERVRHITPIPRYMSIYYESVTDYVWYDQALVITLESGRDYIVDIFAPTDDTYLASARSVPFYIVPDAVYKMLNTWVPDPEIDPTLLEDEPDDYVYPLAPQVVMFRNYSLNNDISPHDRYSRSDHGPSPLYGLMMNVGDMMLTNKTPREPTTSDDIMRIEAEAGYVGARRGTVESIDYPPQVDPRERGDAVLVILDGSMVPQHQGTHWSCDRR